MKAVALIAAALLAGAALGVANIGCLPCDDEPDRFPRNGGTYTSSELAPGYQLVLSTDLKTVTETFEMNGHLYEIVYAALGAPSTTEPFTPGLQLYSQTADGSWIVGDIPTLQTESGRVIALSRR